MNSTHDPSGRRKIISTSGLTLALLLLFLPFVGVSCESPMGSVNAEVSGWDMAVGGKPSVSTTGLFSMGTPAGRDIDSIPVQPLMVLVVVAILCAILLGVIFRSSLTRAFGAAAASGLAVFLLISNQINVTNDFTEKAARDMDSVRTLAADWVGSRIGFWLTAGVLLLITAYHVAGVAASRRAGSSPPADQGSRLAHPHRSDPPPW